MSDRLRVSEASGLMTFLKSHLEGWSRNKIKERLKGGYVTVNGEVTAQHDYALSEGDAVEVLAVGKSVLAKTFQLEILYSDDDLIAINKPAGLLSVATASENKQHALSILRNQLSSPKRPVKLWVVNRLDRDTSGVMLFATSQKMREAVMALWDRAGKTYQAVVEGCPKASKGTIDQPIRQDEKEYRMHVGPHPDAKRAVTHYKVLRTVKTRALLELGLDTGRQHQIRAHMAWLGHAVVGDARYGIDGHRMGLHALRLTILHPKTRDTLTFETPAPNDFMALLK